MRPGLSLALILLAGAATAADEVVFPKDAGVFNVKDFGAKGDGLKDDTAAIQKAIDEDPDGGRIVYLPNGTYKISGTLTWPRQAVGGDGQDGATLQGQSRDKVILRLADASPGFIDAGTPKAMISTELASGPGSPGSIRDLTIDTGRKNPAAIGVTYVANGGGTIRDVTVRSNDGKALMGLHLGGVGADGLLLVKDVKVVGFDTGIGAAGAGLVVAIEGLALQDQNRCGLSNIGACLSVRGMTSRGVATAVINAGGAGLVTLLDADLRGSRGANARPGVLNHGFLLARNVTTAGFAEAIRNSANARRPDPGRVVAEFASHPPIGDTSASPKPLPPRETPSVPWDDLKDWASPTHFGAKPDDDRDDSDAIQKAIDSGKATIYFPAGTYRVGRTVLIRGKVRRLIGCGARLAAGDLKGEPAFRLVGGIAPVVVFERFAGGDAATPTIDNTTNRTLVIRHCRNTGGRFTGTGDLFLEDVSSNASSDWRFVKQEVRARGLAVGNEGTHVVNDGGKLWVLGLKADRGGTLIETRRGGTTEIRGGLRQTATDAKGVPLFVVEGGSALTATIGESSRLARPEDVLVKTPRSGLTRKEAPVHPGGVAMPLVVAYPAKD